jgi:ribosomal protein S18 acetylase RimI-like enzyme
MEAGVGEEGGVSTDATSFSVEFAQKQKADQILDLLCSAKDQIHLKEQVCVSEMRNRVLNEWLEPRCESRCVLVVADNERLLAVAILPEGYSSIEYIVVAEGARRHGLGSMLIRYIRTHLVSGTVRAEARNELSELMLQACGFSRHRDRHVDLLDYPTFVWNKSA